jgi:LPXTG-motif cell wall-anchored protein
LLSIRHFWQEESLVISNSTGMAEQFSYSLAGLTVGALATLFGMFRRNMHLVHLGLGLLIVVIVKVFIVDTSLLSGFWRAGSFLGLGAALVGLGWLFQRITESRRNERTGPTG